MHKEYLLSGYCRNGMYQTLLEVKRLEGAIIKKFINEHVA